MQPQPQLLACSNIGEDLLLHKEIVALHVSISQFFSFESQSERRKHLFQIVQRDQEDGFLFGMDADWNTETDFESKKDQFGHQPGGHQRSQQE